MYQIITLYTLNFHVVCQLYLNKAGKKIPYFLKAKNLNRHFTKELTLLCFALLHFADCVYKLEVCSNSVKPVCWCHFSNSVRSLCVYLSYFGSSHNISNTQPAKRYNSLKDQMMVSNFFNNKVFFS